MKNVIVIMIAFLLLSGCTKPPVLKTLPLGEVIDENNMIYTDEEIVQSTNTRLNSYQYQTPSTNGWFFLDKNTASFKVADDLIVHEIDGNEMSVKNFLANNWPFVYVCDANWSHNTHINVIKSYDANNVLIDSKPVNMYYSSANKFISGYVYAVKDLEDSDVYSDWCENDYTCIFVQPDGDLKVVPTDNSDIK